MKVNNIQLNRTIKYKTVHSKYQAVQEGTNGCNRLTGRGESFEQGLDHHCKLKGGHLFLAQKAWLCPTNMQENASP